MKDFEFRQLIERVRESTDIVQVIGERIGLDRYNKALCPFHDEKTPSFSVNPKGQYFYCFGCRLGGDVFEFLELYEKKPFFQVLSECAAQAGISPAPILASENRQRIRDIRTVEDILTETARFYHQCLTPEVRDYLRVERGLSEETISRFLIGYANGGLREHLTARFPLDLCLKAGVLKKGDGDSVMDYFYQRVIFPNFRWRRVVHLSGRTLDDGQRPKYLHLRGEIRYLYNEDALSNETVYITEGILDCLSAVQEGYAAVATLGLHFKPEHLPKFSRCETVYLCFDGDEAGERGALQIGELIGDRAKIVRLPEGLDLNEYLKAHSKEDFDSLVASSQDIVRYQLSLISPDTDKIELPKKLEPVLKKLAKMDTATAEAYLSREIKPYFGLKKADIDSYRQLVRKYRREAEAPNMHTAGKDTAPVYTARFEGLVDLVEHDGNPAFLLKDGDKLSILGQLERNGTLYVPPPKENIPWLLPRGKEVLRRYELREKDEVLYEDLLAYHHAISELPAEEYYDLIAAWDLHTYLIEAIQYSPFICLFAVPERGKTRTGKGMIYVAYRGIHVESLREAYLVRVARDLQVSIFFDVRDIWQKAEKNGSEDILLQRFERTGPGVPRVLYPEQGPHRDIVYYSTFGPTVIATNEGVHALLETRAIQINMPGTSKRFENDVTPELSLPLKERLVAFRARHLGRALPDIPKPSDGRLEDITKPLCQIIRLVKPEREPAFMRLIAQIEEARLIEKADSLEAQILLTIIELRDQVERGALPVKVITNALNEGKPERRQVTYQRVGRRLSAMGFSKVKASDGGSAILWDEESIERMKETYGLQKKSDQGDEER